MVGVDVSKRLHHVCMVEQHGAQIGKNYTVRNTRASVAAFCERIDRAASERGLTPVVRLEATGVYWWPFLSAIKDKYRVQVFHPTQLKSAREEGIRKTKTDKTDAHTLATTSKQPPQTDYSDETRMKIRELVRYKERLERVKEAQWKRLLRNVFVTFPGLDDEYKFDTLWMRAILETFSGPEELVAAGEEEVARIIGEANGQPGFGKKKAVELIQFCESIITTTFVGDVLGVVNKQILRRIGDLERDIEEIKREVHKLWQPIMGTFAYPSVKGMDDYTSAVIYAELGRLEKYPNEDKVVAAAGFDPVVRQSGDSKGSVGRMSKQGPPTLRKVLVRKTMGLRMSNPIIMAYFEKKKQEGKPYKVNCSACAKRLIRLLWNTEHRVIVERAKQASSASS